jgi:transcriptional regulator with AAA-type ATPase domain
LILGETGSGKGVLARWLHDNGLRGQRGADGDTELAGLEG